MVVLYGCGSVEKVVVVELAVVVVELVLVVVELIVLTLPASVHFCLQPVF